MTRRIAGWLGVAAAMPLGAAAAVAALVIVAGVTGSRLAAAVGGALALIVGTGGLAWAAVGALARSRRGRVRAVAVVTGLAVTVVGTVVGVLVYAPAPPYTRFPVTGEFRHWDLPTGSRIAYTVTRAKGKASSTPVILVHGGPGAPGDGEPGLSAALAEAGFDVYAYHQLGAGLSARLADPSGYTVARHVADLDAVRAAIGAERVVLVGASWGGQLIAAYLAEHPGRVARAVVSSPGTIWPSAFSDSRRLTEAGRRDLDAIVGGYPRLLLGHLLMHVSGPRTAHALLPDEQVDGVYEAVVDGLDLRPGCPATGRDETQVRLAGLGFWANAATTLDSGRVPDPRPRLREVTVPVLVLRGECDYLAWEVTREYRDVLPNAVLIPVDDAGHDVERDRPDVYVPMIRAFLRGGSPPGRPYTAETAPW